MTRRVRCLLVALAVGLIIGIDGCDVYVDGDIAAEREARIAAERRAVAAEQRAVDWQTCFAICCSSSIALLPLSMVFGAWLYSQWLAAAARHASPRDGCRRRLKGRPRSAAIGRSSERGVRVVCSGCGIAGHVPQRYAGQNVRCKRCGRLFLAWGTPSALPTLPAPTSLN